MEKYIIKYGEESLEESRIDSENNYYMKKIFNHVQTFRDLQDCYIAYLEGRIGSNPSYGGPVNPETIALLKKLIRVNDNGFVSITGQPGNCIKKGDQYSLQRTHIEGFMQKSHQNSFIRYMKSYSHYYCEVRDAKNKLFDTFPPGPVYLNRYISENKEVGHSYDIKVGMDSNLSLFSIFSEFSNISNVLQTDSISVIIVAREFNSGSVEDLLLRYFNEIHFHQ